MPFLKPELLVFSSLLSLQNVYIWLYIIRSKIFEIPHIKDIGL